MQALFPDKNNLVVTSPPGAARKTYLINSNCQYVGPRMETTGNQTVDGDYYKVPTNRGNLAMVWVANDQTIAENLKYFCHGHTFGTYRKFGYSVAEIPPMLDEWIALARSVPVDRGKGDIKLALPADELQRLQQELVAARSAGRSVAVVAFGAPSLVDHFKASWNAGTLKWSDPNTIHSFRVHGVTPVGTSLLDSAASSKNTFGHYEKTTTIRDQLQMYAEIISFRFLKSKLATDPD